MTVYRKHVVMSRITSWVIPRRKERNRSDAVEYEMLRGRPLPDLYSRSPGAAKVTSTLLAQSTGANPVVIRNILSALKKAGLITVTRGPACGTVPPAGAITLYQIYSALEPEASPPHRHSPCGQRPCPVAQNIRKYWKIPTAK